MSGRLGFSNYDGNMQFVFISELAMLIAVLILVVLIYRQMSSGTSGMMGAVSDPRRQTTMGGTGSLMLSESGPVWHQNDFEQHYEAMRAEKKPSGYTVPSIAVTRGATNPLRFAGQDGTGGPQYFDY